MCRRPRPSMPFGRSRRTTRKGFPSPTRSTGSRLATATPALQRRRRTRPLHPAQQPRAREAIQLAARSPRPVQRGDAPLCSRPTSPRRSLEAPTDQTSERRQQPTVVTSLRRPGTALGAPTTALDYGLGPRSILKSARESKFSKFELCKTWVAMTLTARPDDPLTQSSRGPGVELAG